MSLLKTADEWHPSKDKWFFFSAGKQGTENWEITCDVCGKKESFVTNKHDYGGRSGSDWDFFGLPYQVIGEWDYYVGGKYTRKRIDFCRTHLQKEIENAVEEKINK